MRRLYSCLFLILLVLDGCRGPVAKSVSPAQDRLNTAALLLDSNSIERIRVVHAPPAEHPFRITLDSLLSDASYSLELSGGALAAHSHDLAEALRSADALPSAWSGDVSWALILYDRDGKETLRVGFDESGTKGYVGADPVQLGNGLVGWARSVLPTR